MQPKTRMTFRFDPPKPVPRPQPAKMHAVPAIEPSAAEQEPEPKAYFSGGPLQDDLYTLEQMIRTAEPIRIRQPIPASPVKVPLPEEEQELEYLTYSDADPAEYSVPGETGNRLEGWLSGALNRKEGPSWGRVFASVAGAIATGALFGYLVLTLFTGETPFPATSQTGKDSPVQATGPQQTAAATAGQGVPASSTSEAGQPAKPAIVAGSSFYLLQYGVFRTEESMRAAMEELKRKGLPAAMDRSDVYRVYVGAADSKEEAELLTGQLPGIEVYVKPAVSQTLEANREQGAAELADFVQRSAELTRTFARLSVSALQEKQPQPFDQTALSALRESHRLWLDSAKAAANLTGEAGKAAKDMEQSLNAAMISVDDYDRKVSRYPLWNIQSKVMQAVFSERDLREALQSGTPK